MTAPLLFGAILLAAFTYGRKPADRIERRKEVYDYEFGLFQSIPAKHIATAITIDIAKSRKNSLGQQLFVRICIVGLRPTSPMTSNHFPMIATCLAAFRGL